MRALFKNNISRFKNESSFLIFLDCEKNYVIVVYAYKCRKVGSFVKATW